ncbi:MAG: adenylosuccinate synthetase, partial [Lachnospiraceae bacterium]|nr:adenylosuccinate synthetase [Lachnospiraceae bacterium]
DNIIENYIHDFMQMLENVRIVNNDIVDSYDYVIFEGAQGLLLDQNNLSYMPHLTPSNTGIKNPLNIIGKRNPNVEVCYVSRTYMTRHGAGRFDTECNKSDINEKIIDLTNVPNPYQDSIRYGMLILDELKNRIQTDFGNMNGTKSLAVTHWNEYTVNQDELKSLFDGFNIYLSDGMTHDDIYRL